MKNIKYKYVFILLSLFITNIHSQNIILRGDLIFNVTDKVYNNYYGFLLNSNFPLSYNNFYIGPYVKIFSSAINNSVEQMPKNASNRGLSLGLRTVYMPTESISLKIIYLQPYLGLALGYQFNHIYSTSSFADDIADNIVFNELVDDLVKEFLLGFSFIFKKQKFPNINIELSYQFRKPILNYTKSSDFENNNYKNEIKLNAFFFSMGMQFNI